MHGNSFEPATDFTVPVTTYHGSLRRRWVRLAMACVVPWVAGRDLPPRAAHGRTELIGERRRPIAEPIHLEPCDVAEVDGPARCGWYHVPENRQTPRGRQLRLRVVVLSARDAVARQVDPILLLTGGPGIGVASEAWIANILRDARERRDVVLVDVRGTGASDALRCHVYGSGRAPFLRNRFPARALGACRDTLARRADLTQYTSAIAADDLDDVRAALGYERINLVGLSYWSKLALVYLRQHPTHVRRAVLDAVVPTAFPAPLPAAAAGDRALRRVFADCLAQPSCARAYPHLEAHYGIVVARLRHTPAPVDLSPARVGRPGVDTTVGEPAELTVDAFRTGLWEHLYAADDAREIPRLIGHAARGDVSFTARRIAAHNRGSWPRIDLGAMLAIHCTEDVPLIAADDVARAEASSLVGAPHTRALMAACERWPRGTVPIGYRDPVASSIPVLLLSGELDPMSGPEWAATLMRSLPNSRHIVRPGAGHLDDDACTFGLMADFLSRPDPRALTAPCAARSRRSAFVVD